MEAVKSIRKRRYKGDGGEKSVRKEMLTETRGEGRS
jgi:hypothetical protein